MEIIKIRVEINDIENKEKSVFEINKINNL